MADELYANFELRQLLLPGNLQMSNDHSASNHDVVGELANHAPQGAGLEIEPEKYGTQLADDDAIKQTEFNSSARSKASTTSNFNSSNEEPHRGGSTSISPPHRLGGNPTAPSSMRIYSSGHGRTSAAPNANHKVRVSTINAGDRGRCTNKEVTWKQLCSMLSTAQKDQQHTHLQYLALGVDDKNKAKDVGSYMLGQFKNNKRRKANIKSRSRVALDIDVVTPDQMAIFKLGRISSELWDYEFFATTTRSNTIMAPKWRIVFPTKKMIPAEHYPAVARILSSKLFADVQESMEAVDDVTHRVAQIMYWPSQSSDQPFDSYLNERKLLDHEALLASHDGWEDYTKLPFSEKRGIKRPGQLAPAERPNEKKGLVGAFCRAYTVPEAMEKFIPGVYVDPKQEGRDLRYTYAAGHGSKGAIVYDGGLFLYSHHGTDPCGERNVNAFDMVRLHLFGSEDTKEDGLTPTQQPSYKAM